ncbi:MAG: histidine kinase [Saprospiraceae bacterium]|nr:histidine kinase [Saprospiraceae bacterium]
MATLEAQLPLYKNFTDEDGLPSNTTYQIFEDPKGYLYITTAKGICRFDGAEFVKINLPNLQSEDMPMAAMDSQGRLFTANLAGELVCVDGLNSKIINLENYPQNSTIKSIDILNNILRIRFLTHLKSEVYTFDYNLKDLKFLRIFNISNSGYFIGELLGLSKSEKYFNIYIKEGTYSVSGKIFKEDIMKNGSIFFPNVLLNNDTNTVKYNDYNLETRFDINFKTHYPFVVNSIIIKDTNRIILINNSKETHYGVYLTNLDKNNYYQVIKGIKINNYYETPQKQLWFTSSDKGIFVIPNISLSKVEEFANEKIIFNSISNNNMICINANGLINELNIHNNQSIKLINDISTSNIISVVNFRNKNLYVFKHGIFEWKYKKLLPVFENQNIKYVLNFKNNSIIAAYGNGIEKIDFNNKNKVEKIKNILLLRSYALNHRNDTILLGSTKGLYGFAKDLTFQFKGFKNFELYITKLYVDSLKTIWICTDGKGLIAYNNEKDVKYFGLSEGMPSLNCNNIVHLDVNRIAVGTDKGLWIYNLKSKNSFILNKLDGLSSNEITTLSSDGSYLWIGTANGMVKCKIDELKPNPEIPFVEITKKEYEFGGNLFELTDKISYQQNRIIFQLSSRSLLAGKTRNYFYRVIGIDTNWIRTSDQKIELLGLKSGSYIFEVKVYNEDGVPCLTPASYSFTISPPWWRTIWFYSLIILLIGGAIFWWLKIIKKREAQKYQVQNQINEFRQQALQSQMNPHFIFNSLNAIQSFLTINDEKNAMLYLSKFGRLIRLIFDQSKVKLISIEDEIEMLKNYLELEKLRFKGKVDVRLVIDKEVKANEQDIMIPPLLIQPIIENSFRHGLFHKGEGGILEVIFTIENNRLKSIVRDNGIGRMKSKEINKWRDRSHKSSGLSTTMDRIKILDNNQGIMKLIINDLEDQNGIPTGTETIIYF